MARKRATVSVNVETVPAVAYDYSVVDTAGVISLSVTEECHGDLDVARLLKRLAYMVHPKVDEP